MALNKRTSVPEHPSKPGTRYLLRSETRLLLMRDSISGAGKRLLGSVQRTTAGKIHVTSTRHFTNNRVVSVNLCGRSLNFTPQFRIRPATDALLFIASTVLNYCPNGPLTVPIKPVLLSSTARRSSLPPAGMSMSIGTIMP